jgi:ComF family protein
VGAVGWIGEGLQAVVGFLIDERCHACGAPVPTSKSSADHAPSCHPLAAPLRVRIGPFLVGTRLLCERCALRIRPWREPLLLPAVADAAGALVVYPAFSTDDNLLRLIHLMKFARRERLAPWFARAIANGLPRRALDELSAPAVLVPVPMDTGSRRRRGFNQAERIAAELARAWEVPIAPRALVKTRRTLAQSSLGRSDRARNLWRAMIPGSESVTGRCVVLVDDLVTTGATAAACAAVLRLAGAVSVRVVCVGYRP